MERRLAAILVADVVGFSRLTGEDEEGTLASLKELRTTFIEPLIAEHNGRVVKLMGDGFLVEFRSAVDAVKCAVAWQQGLLGRQAGDALRFRIAVNLGDIVIDGDDILGDGVNIAARLEGLAEPGGVAISDMVHENVKGRLDLRFNDSGAHALKNIDEPVRIWTWRGEDAVTGPVDKMQPPTSKPSVAVLPFENNSGDPEQDYLARGIAEDLLTALARSKLFVVVAWDAARAVTGTTEPAAMGRLLNASYVVRGSVRKAGDRLRVTAQLTDAKSGQQFWADRYDGTVEDVFDLQDRIAASVAAAVLPELSRAELERTKRRRPEHLTAWDHYLRASTLVHDASMTAIDEAIAELRSATALDPEYAPAHALLARSHVTASYQLRGAERELAIRRAAEAVSQALRFDPQDAMAYEAQASLHTVKGELEAAILAARKALDIDPSLSKTYGVLANALAFMGESEQALEVIEEGDRISPRDPYRHQRMMAAVNSHFAAGDYEAAVKAGQQYVLERPNWYGVYVLLAASYALLGRSQEANRAASRLRELLPSFSLRTVKRRPMFKQDSVANNLLRGLRESGVPET